jgi:hypothetical protein
MSKVEATYEASKAMTLNVFHSLMRESMNTSQECLNRIRAGETNGGVHSSKQGKDTGAVTPHGDPDTAPVERSPGKG